MLLVKKIEGGFTHVNTAHTHRMLCWNKMFSEFKDILDDSPLYRVIFAFFTLLCFGELIGTLLCLTSLSMMQCSSLIAIAVPITPVGTILLAMTIQYIVCSYTRKPVLPSTVADIVEHKSVSSETLQKISDFEGSNPLRVIRVAATPQKVRSSAIAPPMPPPAPKKQRRVLDDDFVDVNPLRDEGVGVGVGVGIV
jgi:hypothetical protein